MGIVTRLSVNLKYLFLAYIILNARSWHALISSWKSLFEIDIKSGGACPLHALRSESESLRIDPC